MEGLFSEVRYRKQRPSNNKDHAFGRYAAPGKPCKLPPLANRGEGPKYPLFDRPTKERVLLMKRNLLLVTVASSMLAAAMPLSGMAQAVPTARDDAG